MPLPNIQEIEVFDCWGIDFIGSLPSSFSNEYILMAVEYVSRWMEVIPTQKVDAKTMIKFLKKHIFCRFGTPRVVISDGGAHFHNTELKKTFEHYGVKHMIATTYHPQINRQAEVCNREVKRILEKIVSSSREIGLSSWMRHCGRTEQPSRHQLHCLHFSWYMGRLVIFLWRWSIELFGH